jgi:hypothetical protein
MAIKSYRNPNIPKPKPNPGDSSGEALIKPPRYVGKPVLVGPREERGKNRPGPLTPRTPGVPGKREGRPLPNPITKPFDLRKEKQLPRKVTSVISKRKPAPKGKGGR